MIGDTYLIAIVYIHVLNCLDCNSDLSRISLGATPAEHLASQLWVACNNTMRCDHSNIFWRSCNIRCPYIGWETRMESNLAHCNAEEPAGFDRRGERSWSFPCWCSQNLGNKKIELISKRNSLISHQEMLHKGVRLGPGHPNPSLRILELSLQPGRCFSRYWPSGHPLYKCVTASVWSCDYVPHNVLSWRQIFMMLRCSNFKIQWWSVGSVNIIILPHHESYRVIMYSTRITSSSVRQTATLRFAAMGCRTKPTAGHEVRNLGSSHVEWRAGGRNFKLKHL